MAERKTKAQQLAAAEKKAARLRAEMSEAARKLDARQKIIIGGTVIAAMEADPELKARVCSLLQQNVTRPKDKEAVQPWLSTP
jgi:hypothetical protein